MNFLSLIRVELQKEYTISSGDHYIVLKGDDFSGSLKLEVK